MQMDSLDEKIGAPVHDVFQETEHYKFRSYSFQYEIGKNFQGTLAVHWNTVIFRFLL